MEKGCFLSVIIPVYNCAEYLKECIGSIVNQNFSDMELIIVDDGSTDGSGLICDEIKESVTLFPVSVIHQENKGVSSARNAGIACSKGEWVSFIDADDTIKAGMFNTYFAMYNQYYGSVDLIVSGNEIITSKGNVGGKYLPVETQKYTRGGVLLAL